MRPDSSDRRQRFVLQVVAAVANRLDSGEIIRRVEPRYRNLVMDVPIRRKRVESVFSDEGQPVNVDCRVIASSTTADVLVSLSSMVKSERFAVSHSDHRPVIRLNPFARRYGLPGCLPA